MEPRHHHLYQILVPNMPKSSTDNYCLEDFENDAYTGEKLTCASRYKVKPKESKGSRSFWKYTPSPRKKETAVPESREDPHDTIARTFCDQLTARKSRAADLLEHDNFLASEADELNQSEAATESVLWAGHTKPVRGRMVFKILVADRKSTQASERSRHTS